MNLSQSDLDYIATQTAYKLRELLQNPEQTWVSQNKAWKHYGGRAFVENLRMRGKVRTRKCANRVEYYVKDLVEYSMPKNRKL